MRSALLLVLFLTLSDGSSNVSFSDAEPDVFSKRFSNRVGLQPCERSHDNNGYNRFRHRHVLSTCFDTGRAQEWENYLTTMNLCGREFVQSFLPKSDNASVVRICNGRGNKDTRNQCISKRKFKVYIVRSALRNGHCVVQSPVQSKRRYVTVSCEVIEKQCLPVHYARQTRFRPSPPGRTCRPRTV